MAFLPQHTLEAVIPNPWGKLTWSVACFTMVLMTSFVVWKISSENSIRKGGLFWSTAKGCSSLRWGGGHHGRSVRQLVTMSPQSGSRETNSCWCSACFLSFPHSETPVLGMVSPTSRLCLSVSLKLFWKYIHKDTPRGVLCWRL